MKKQKIVIVVYLISIIIGSVLVNNYMSEQKFGNELFPTSINRKIEMVKDSQVKKNDIYCSMANIKNYPKILSEYVSSITIINQTKNVVFVEENLQSMWITTKILSKHTFFPYDKHVIEIIGGDANGTKIDIEFEEIESGTRLKSKIDMKLKGLLVPFGLIPVEQLKYAINTVFVPFESDAINNNYTC